MAPSNAQFVANNAIHDDRVRDAVLDLCRRADCFTFEHPTIDSIRTSSRIFRAPIQQVAAALGYLRCVTSGAWIDLRDDPAPRDEHGQLRVGDAEHPAVYGCLCLWIAAGGPCGSHHRFPAGVAERIEQLTGGSLPDPQSPAAAGET